MTNPVSHVMPEEVKELMIDIEQWPGDTHSLAVDAVVAAPHIKAAYAKIDDLQQQLDILGRRFQRLESSKCELEERFDRFIENSEIEIGQLKSQLSTLKAQTKEVIWAGDGLEKTIAEVHGSPNSISIIQWRNITDALRQSGLDKEYNCPPIAQQMAQKEQEAWKKLKDNKV